MSTRIAWAWLFAIFVFAVAAPSGDEVTALPGWSGPLPSKQYSGYLSIEGGTNLHYWLALSEKTPTQDPVVIWLNGGPGCSSLDGWSYENGPFEIQEDNTLTLRPYRWNRIANVLFIESPVGVGFSYSSTQNYTCDDDRTAIENRLAVEQFFKLFPELQQNSLYITGESYAGVYVPTLAEAILQGEKDGTYTGAKLAGIAVGNGCSGNQVGICGWGPQGTYYEWLYLLSSSLVERSLKEKANSLCNWTAAQVNIPDSLSPACESALGEAGAQIGHVDLYNIYGDCVSGGCHVQNGKIPGPPSVAQRRILPGGPDACIDSRAASAFFNQPLVQSAIHVREPGFCWSVCSSQPGWTYKPTRPNLPRDTYPFLVANIDVIIYNGDWDACVPYTDGESWTKNMNFPVKSHWHPWLYTSVNGNKEQVAGYATVYDVSALGKGSFSFITVKGGRHEVPETAPAQALEMLGRLFNGTAF